MRPIALVLVAILASCGESAPAVSWQTVEGLQYAVPLGWSVRDQSEQTRKILVWTPDDNDQKESVTIIKTQSLVSTTNGGLPRLQGLLAAASAGLPASSFTKPTKVVTSRGLVGMRVDGQFVPSAIAAPYRRIHVVMLDGRALIHLLFTSKDMTAEPEGLRIVLETLHRTET